MNPRLAQAHNHLIKGEYQLALATAQKMARMGGQGPEVHTVIGVAARNLGNFVLAQSALQKVVQLVPTSAAAWGNLAQLGIAIKDASLAEGALRKAIALAPENPEHPATLSTLLMQRGQPQSALEVLAANRARHPSHLKTQALFTNLQSDFLPLEEWSQLWQPSSKITPQSWPAEQQVMLAHMQLLWAWVAGTAGQFHAQRSYVGQMLERMRQAGASHHIHVKNAAAYFLMLEGVQGPAPARNPALPALPVLGESHTILPHGQTAVWQGTSYQLQASLIFGLTLWHLANPVPTVHRALLLQRLQNLPPASTVLLLAGEIDTRPTAGMYARAQKHNKPWASVISATISPALEWLKANAQGHTVILVGSPAPNPLKLKVLPEEQHADYTAFAIAADTALKAACARHRLSLVDMFTYTQQHPACMADAHHPGPDALPQALQSHLRHPA
ncbi:MAG: hypothetical protein GC129_03940 [Proteobacteria bacterium]|nr:hypothetical protein [Pseudomonadota bacterium]